MRTISSLVLGALFSFALAPQLSATPQFGRERTQDSRDRVCFYGDVRYQGWEQCYTAGDEITSLGSHKAAASSLRIFGRARVIVWDETGFNGRTTEFTSDVPDLNLRAASGGHTWNDRISSLRVVSGNEPPVSGGGNRYPDSRYPDNRFPDNRSDNRYPEQRVTDGICVFDRPNFEGRSQCWNTGEQLGDLARAGGWSDRISSIRVFGRAAAVLYRDSGFRGESIVVDSDIPDLSRLAARGFGSWNNQISSIQIEERRGGRGRARGRQWRDTR